MSKSLFLEVTDLLLYKAFFLGSQKKAGQQRAAPFISLGDKKAIFKPECK
jgi:hypothetical protein